MKRWHVFSTGGLAAVMILLLDWSAAFSSANSAPVYLDRINLPPGFNIGIYTDGSLLISDDRAGVIYRITYEK